MSTADPCVITVEQGPLKGKKGTDRSGQTYYSFQGIPYAKPPVGNLRFKAPQSPESWHGTLDATEERDECFAHHMILRHIVGSENCLFLNVYTPSLDHGNKCPDKGKFTLKPVMFFIHGGGFVLGSSKTEVYGPEFLVAEDVVLVTFNYRLGLLGFLAIEDPALGVPGNAALKDMVMALKWVQKNIKNFNGDPNNVTIFGESAGGASVHFLMLSPMAKGLFHKAIAQSGCATNLWACGTFCLQEAAEKLGLKTKNEAEILAKMQECTLEDLLAAQDKMYDGITAHLKRSIGPVIEKATANEPAFISQDPSSIIKSGDYNKVPLIMGYTNMEGILFETNYLRSKEPRLISDFELYVPFTLNLPLGSTESKEMADRIRKFYFKDSEISMENIEKDIHMRSDIFFLKDIHHSIALHLKSGLSPIYLYRFSAESTLSFYKKFTGSQIKGVCHADDLGYLFKMIVTPEIEEGSIEDKTIKRVTKLWTNFAKNGNPNPPLAEPLIPTVWVPVDADNHYFLDIGEELKTGINPDADRMRFWDGLYQFDSAVSKL